MIGGVGRKINNSERQKKAMERRSSERVGRGAGSERNEKEETRGRWKAKETDGRENREKERRWNSKKQVGGERWGEKEWGGKKKRTREILSRVGRPLRVCWTASRWM